MVTSIELLIIRWLIIESRVNALMTSSGLYFGMWFCCTMNVTGACNAKTCTAVSNWLHSDEDP